MKAKVETSAQLLAAGYPHLRRLVTPHPDEAKAIACAERALDEIDPISYHVTWPRDVALRYLRGLGEVGAHGIGIFSLHLDAPLPEARAARAAVARGGEIDVALATQIIERRLAPGAGGYGFHAAHAVFLLEELVGGAAVVEAALAFWERTPGAKWDASHNANELAYHLGFVLARLPPKKAAPLVKRARALVAKGRPADCYTAEMLDYAVNGADAIARNAARRPGLYFMHFVDDPARLLEVAASTPNQIDAHHVHRGGQKLLAVLGAKLTKVPKWRKPWLVDELAVLGSKAAKAVAAKLPKHAPKKR